MRSAPKTVPAASIVHPAPAPRTVLLGPPNTLVSWDRSLDTAVGVYGDCMGSTPIDAHIPDVDTCFTDRTYFVGHNPGVFTPLLRYGVGARLTWFDSQGVGHQYQVVRIRDLSRDSPDVVDLPTDVAAQFQTCLTLDGSEIRLLDAIAV